MTQEEFIIKALEAHKLYLNHEKGGACADLSGAYLDDADLSHANLSHANLSHADLSCANLSGAIFTEADLSCADLSDADLSGTNLHGANLSGADLSGADLSHADLSRADLSNVNLPGANLSGANLSGAKNLLSAIDFLDSHFVRSTDGYIVYKTFNGSGLYRSPDRWDIKPGSIIEETVNPDRCMLLGSGINVAPLEWVKRHCGGEIWKCLIRWEWLLGVVVPYNVILSNTMEGMIRCERLELIEIVERTVSPQSAALSARSGERGKLS